jgi:hypothetical protein
VLCRLIASDNSCLCARPIFRSEGSVLGIVLQEPFSVDGLGFKVAAFSSDLCALSFSFLFSSASCSFRSLRSSNSVRFRINSCFRIFLQIPSSVNLLGRCRSFPSASPKRSLDSETKVCKGIFNIGSIGGPLGLEMGFLVGFTFKWFLDDCLLLGDSCERFFGGIRLLDLVRLATGVYFLPF